MLQTYDVSEACMHISMTACIVYTKLTYMHKKLQISAEAEIKFRNSQA